MVAAAQLLHAAGRVPYDASHPDQWRRAFQRLVADAAQAVAMYRVAFLRPDATMNLDRADWRRFARAAERRCEQHRKLSERTRRLARRAEGRTEIHEAVDMMEEALQLEREVMQCYEKYVNLVFESHNSEIGGLG